MIFSRLTAGLAAAGVLALSASIAQASVLVDDWTTPLTVSATFPTIEAFGLVSGSGILGGTRYQTVYLFNGGETTLEASGGFLTLTNTDVVAGTEVSGTGLVVWSTVTARDLTEGGINTGIYFDLETNGEIHLDIAFRDDDQQDGWFLPVGAAGQTTNATFFFDFSELGYQQALVSNRVIELRLTAYDGAYVKVGSIHAGPGLPTVPLPAGAWFLLTAIGGLGGLRWLNGRCKDRVTG